MRDLLGFLSIGLLAACGKVQSTEVDAPANDSAVTDSPTDDGASPDAPAGPTPVLYWSFDNNVSNTGALAGYTLATPAGMAYGAGKFGQAGAYAAGQYAYVDGMRASLDTYAKVTVGFWLKEPGNLPGVAIFDCNNRTTSPFGGVQIGLTSTSVAVCVSTTTNAFLSGGCNGFTTPSPNVWHHWIMRYDGTGTAAGQGGPTQIYIDDVLVHTRANDAANNPVFNTTGTPDRLSLGSAGASIDDVRVYNQVFTPMDQCTYVIRGTWTGTTCTLP